MNKLRIYHLTILVALSAVASSLVVAAIHVDDSILRAWSLGLLAVTLPWAGLGVVRRLLMPGACRWWLTLVLLWAPVGFILVLIHFQKALGLDPEFGVTPVASFCVLLVPGLCLFLGLKARPRSSKVRSG